MCCQATLTCSEHDESWCAVFQFCSILYTHSIHDPCRQYVHATHINLLALSPGYFQILYCSRGEKPIFLHSCEIKSGSDLGMRLSIYYVRNRGPHHVTETIFQGPGINWRKSDQKSNTQFHSFFLCCSQISSEDQRTGSFRWGDSKEDHTRLVGGEGGGEGCPQAAVQGRCAEEGEGTSFNITRVYSGEGSSQVLKMWLTLCLVPRPHLHLVESSLGMRLAYSAPKEKGSGLVSLSHSSTFHVKVMTLWDQVWTLSKLASLVK